MNQFIFIYRDKVHHQTFYQTFDVFLSDNHNIVWPIHSVALLASLARAPGRPSRSPSLRMTDRFRGRRFRAQDADVLGKCEARKCMGGPGHGVFKLHIDLMVDCKALFFTDNFD